MLNNDFMLKAKDGALITGKAYNVEDESVKGILVICHGFGEHTGNYADFVDHLVSENYACIVFNQRGHGKLPEKKLGVIPSYQSFLDDISTIIADIKQKAPNKPIALYGHSMGGNIASNYLFKCGQSDFTCAILESPWLGLYKEAHPLKVIMAKTLSYVFPDVPLPKKDTELPLSDITSDVEKQKEFKEDPLYHNRMSLRMFKEINDGCTYAMDNASSLSIPTFIAIAEDERIVSNEAIEKFREKCSSDIVSKEEYASRHSIHNDKKRADFHIDVIAFLNKHCHTV